ncbi:MAG: aminotransferase class I/II-fold pyridoxal phosphate-dependent enzyme [Actinobacteria bacterium]|jgi:alanine-synthesizing transaminase|nr:aminotransferase class I/II-fold pyridoxal phosphate-dependent enzyme [Actinomycetota bacterium]MCZ6567050.1 aminotransferase class I/II-fold pyridoxal phosphate-dependent enzyme [Actinomycetota bacterium]MCZ6631230.1 aminotransferase class I/II-fold pyridoxal phosphate-dependent enzyme [Actinomycetota bacterium]MCZ6737730.1 aminotransferase class I/II-fold pyridoxal phosphate-dependent enzyme [Actinomycetota bacterium]
MDFRRVGSLPPYAFAEVNRRKAEVRLGGSDVIDLGFGNPDIPSPDEAVETLIREARQPSNHRYSVSRGIQDLREALAGRYMRRFGVELDPDTEIISTIGAKEGLSHLMWTLVQPGDAAIVPEPSYPIHIYAPIIAGAEVRRAPIGSEEDYFEIVNRMFGNSWPRPRVIIVSFPHNPTTKTVDLGFFSRLVDFAKANDVVLVHDFAYADIAFDGYRPPSILEVPGAKDVAVELYSLTKGHSMAGWRVGFLAGNSAVVGALAKLKSYLDYGTFQPIQIAAAEALATGDGFVAEVNKTYMGRRDALVDGLADIGWKVDKPMGTMFVWAEVPGPYDEMGSLDFSIHLLEHAGVAVSPGVGFGPSGEGHVRFALVEDVGRIEQAADRIGESLDRL